MDYGNKGYSLKLQHQILIYSQDAAMRKAYASYLNRNGLPTDSCGTLVELTRLLSWYDYDFVLINIDTLENKTATANLSTIITHASGQHQIAPLIIATSIKSEASLEHLDYDWFLQEPLTPKGLLTTISTIRQQRPKFPERGHIKLRQSLSKPITFD